MTNCLKYTALALALVGCGAEEALEPAALDELCGAREPFHLLPLRGDQTLSDGLELFAGRIYYTLAREERVPGPNKLSEHVLWSIGPCGEDPRQIAEDVTSTFHDEHWPDVLLGCREQQRDIVAVDPAGAAPNVVFSDIDCDRFARTTYGYVTREGTRLGDVTLHPYPDDPRSATSEPVALLEPSEIPSYDPTLREPILVRGDSVFVNGDDRTLVRIDLADMRRTVEQTGVGHYTLSPDARYVLWQESVPRADDSSQVDVVYLRDRTTGDGQALARAALIYEFTPFALIEHGLLTLYLQTGVLRVYTLPATDFVDLPGYLHLRAQLADGRWLLQRADVGQLLLVDPRDPGALTPLFGYSKLLEVRADGLVVLEYPTDDQFEEGPLWFVPLDGGAPRRLAGRVGKHHRLDGQRLLTTVSVDRSILGDLVLVDLTTGEEQLVDRRVGAASFWTDRDLGDDLVQYRVYDRERTGVWLVRPPAGE